MFASVRERALCLFQNSLRHLHQDLYGRQSGTTDSGKYTFYRETGAFGVTTNTCLAIATGPATLMRCDDLSHGRGRAFDYHVRLNFLINSISRLK
jgi:hypothetical protein